MHLILLTLSASAQDILSNELLYDSTESSDGDGEWDVVVDVDNKTHSGTRGIVNDWIKRDSQGKLMLLCNFKQADPNGVEKKFSGWELYDDLVYPRFERAVGEETRLSVLVGSYEQEVIFFSHADCPCAA